MLKLSRITITTKLRGFTLVELIFSSAIVALALIATMSVAARRANYGMLDAAAKEMAAVGNALQNYESHYATQLVAGTAVPGVALPMQPTIAELTALGYTPPGFDATRLPGGDMQTTISLTPAGCLPADCNLYWFSTATRPFLQVNGVPDEAAAGRVVQAIGMHAGYSHIDTPGIINGYNGLWGPGVVNPTGLAGIVALRGGYGASELAQYLRIDGGNAMTADFHGGGHDLTNVHDATISNNLKVEGDQVNLKSLTVGSFIKVSADPTQTATAGAVCVEGNGAMRADSIGKILSCQNGVWASALGLAVDGSSCAINGALGQTASGATEVCSGGFWMPLNQRMGSAVFVDAFIVPNGAGVPAPACGAGAIPRIYVIPRSMSSTHLVYPGALPTDPLTVTFSENEFATGSGPWTVNMTDGTGAPLSGSMIAQTYCEYP